MYLQEQKKAVFGMQIENASRSPNRNQRQARAGFIFAERNLWTESKYN